MEKTVKAICDALYHIARNEPEQALIILREVVRVMEDHHDHQTWVDDGWCG